MDVRADDIKINGTCENLLKRSNMLLAPSSSSSTPSFSSSSYHYVAYDVSLHDGGQLFLVVGTEEPLLSAGRQGVEGLVRGPQHGERLVDLHLQDGN